MTATTMIIGATPTANLARLHQLVSALESAVATGTRAQAIQACEDVHLAVIQVTDQARKASDWRGAIERAFGEARG